MSQNKITTSEWIALVAKAGGEPDKIPAGWLSPEMIAKQINKSVNRTRALLTELCKRNLAEAQKFRILTSRGLYPVRHYRVKKPRATS